MAQNPNSIHLCKMSEDAEDAIQGMALQFGYKEGVSNVSGIYIFLYMS